jgi:hypothetical protein
VTAKQEEPTWESEDTWDTWDNPREIRRHRRIARWTRRSRVPLLAGLIVLVTSGVVIVGALSGGGLPKATSRVASPTQPTADLTGSAPQTPLPSPAVAFPESLSPRPAATGYTPPPAVPTTARSLTQPQTPAQATATTQPPPSFVPISVEAEAPQSVMTGGAAKVACPSCSGGWRVGSVAAGARSSL